MATMCHLTTFESKDVWNNFWVINISCVQFHRLKDLGSLIIQKLLDIFGVLHLPF